MKKVNPKVFSKSQTDLAGEILRNPLSSEEDKNNALEVLSNWRGAHSYPMHVFKQRLKNVSEKIDQDALSAQRLKRVPSIIKKIDRKYNGKKATMKLTQMQDIAGCRVVMSDVLLAKKLYQEYYIKSDLKHKKVNEKDYIAHPKKDGYRSIHLIYKYYSDKGKVDYNGLLVEVQIRSKLQHIWATAVETVDFFTRQAIKSNQGQEDWIDFFRLVSSAFAKFEDCPTILGTPEDEKQLYSLIKQKEIELQVRAKMSHWTKSIKLFDNLKNKKNLHFFLLELDTIQEKLTISAYSKRQEQKAILDYSTAEKKIYGKREYDVVLVGADTVKDLKKAYPNYFLDTKEFLIYLNKILNKYSD
ncbi:MAG: RelA/SpoT domain-containing protein [Nanoarchaeota archaeon]|nr:RelA/SpoT domain-containing protein [Nanoarchaeota archaeon]MBU1623353.1 RelA/SpoT domain-containing protein [Nanoarchaeota archaeon]MBU1974529.1 RelA/SpoT domain-containing protein [Nanoarchaeota archaeon]